MIDCLRDIMKVFPGDANHSRCFNHVITLVAKRMVRQFNVNPKEANAELDEAEQALRDLAEGIESEELMMRGSQDADDEEDDDKVDEEEVFEEKMSPEDRAELERLVLVKVGQVDDVHVT